MNFGVSKMKTADSYLTESSTHFEEIIGTSAAPDEELASGSQSNESTKWDSIIDDYLIEWGSNPGQIAVDDDTPPSSELIHRAIDIAKELKNQNFDAADRVVPNGDGGLTFEWFKENGFFFVLELRKNNDIVVETYENGNLINEKRLA